MNILWWAWHEVQILLCVSLMPVSNTYLFANGIKWGMIHSPKMMKPGCSQTLWQWATLPRSYLSPLPIGRMMPFPTHTLMPSHLQPGNVTATAAIDFLGKEHLGNISCISDCLPLQLSSRRTGTEPERRAGKQQSHECWVTRICRAGSCTAGPDPCPRLMINLNRTNCMFHTLRTMDNWKLTSTWETCFG